MIYKLTDPTTPSATATLDEQRWQAVSTRTATDEFVFGVTTTGIYCRSGCPARTPLRAHVRYFATAAAARVAGFRACKRCHPDVQ